jgi:hypothetical protein
VFAPRAPNGPGSAANAEAALYPPANAAPAAAKRWDVSAAAATGSFNNDPPANAYPAPNSASPAHHGNSAMPEANTSGFHDYPPPIPPAAAKRLPPPLPGPSARLNDRMPPAAYANPPRPEIRPAAPPMAAELWRVETTAKANYFNLGGHVDRDGVVDSLASSYLRDALKTHRNFPKLPPHIKAYIDAPTINLAKIAGYRAMLGIDDRKMEEEQGVKFVRVASRGLDLTIPGADAEEPAAGSDVPPLDLNALERMLSASGGK